jgi:NADPH-dependent glutamate synthase beta subunit-like oxidoreductase
MGAEPLIVYRRTREKMPAHDFEVEEALQEGIMVKWLSTIKQADESSLTIEKMALDSKGFPQPTGEFETIEADSLVLALGQDVDLGLLEGVPGLQVSDGVVQVGANMMTGHPGIFAGGDMVPAERNVTVGIGHGKAGSQAHRCLAARRAICPTAKTRSRSVRQPQHLVLRRCAENRTSRCWTSSVASRPSTKSRAVSTRAQRSLKPDAAFPAATASNATTATVSARTTR